MNDAQLENEHPFESSNEIETPQEKTGTKIGEVSDFEKELIQSEVIEQSRVQVSETVDDHSDDSFFATHLNQDFNDFVEGDIVKARVRTVKKSGVLVDFSYKSDGFIPSNELTDSLVPDLEEGFELHAMIQKLETKEGYSLLSETNARAEMVWDELFDIMNRKEVVSIQIKKMSQKGYLVDYQGASGFLHAEEGDAFSEKDTVQALIINVDKRRRKVLFSTRNIQNVLHKKEEVGKFLDTVQIGDTLKGTISGIKKFGVFVNLGHAEGLVHISEISWRRISHPSDVVELGQEVDVEILSLDKEQGKLSLGMKQLSPDPWETIDANYEVGQVVSGKVVRIIDFGAFVLIDKDLEGLVHISEVSSKRINSLEDVLSVGDTVNVKIIKLTKHDQKIGLSIKNVAQDNPEIDQRIDAV
jgi:small subunit ribosomal protein S1